MVEVLTLHLLLIGLPVVEVVEVGDDDGDGQGDGEHTRDRAQGAHDLAPHAHRPGEAMLDLVDISERLHTEAWCQFISRTDESFHCGFVGVPPGYLIHP